MTRRQRQKPLIVDDKPFLYWISELPYDDAGAVPLRVVLRADFGTRSFCTISGLTNRKFWHDFPVWDTSVTISVTPGIVCDLIRLARVEGWDPNVSRTNYSLSIDNSILGALRSHTGG